MRYITIMIMLFAGLNITACAKTTVEELKSPCVSADTGAPGAVNPCGPRRSINNSWLNS